MPEAVQRDDGAVWLAAVLGIACIEYSRFRMRYSDLYQAVHDLADDNTIPFTPRGHSTQDDPHAQPLPGFYDALLLARTYGVETDGESGEYVFVDSRQAEKMLERAVRKMGPGYIETARRHARRLCDILQKE